MKPAIVRIPDFDPRDGRVYSLNWGGRLRRGPEQLEIFTRLVAEPQPGKPPKHVDRWVRLTDFPYLILGSRWYRGVMVGKPLGRRTIELKSSKIVKVHGVSCTPTEGRLWFGDDYRLAFDSPAAPVLEFESEEGDRIFLPLTELYRSHYFSIPRAIDSLVGGLVSGALDNPNIAAWDPGGTKWVDGSRLVAQMAPAKFIQRQQAIYLARLIFSSEGNKSLKDLHRSIQASFVDPPPTDGKRRSTLLPILKLPYFRATWDASVIALPPDDEGHQRLLVLHIESFEAREPYSELICVDPYPNKSGKSQGNGEQEPTRSEVLEPNPGDELDDIEDGWDPGLEPVRVDDVITRDDACARRQPEVVRRPPDPGDDRLVFNTTSEIDVDEGSTASDGNRGTNVAPIVFSDAANWPERSQALKLSFEQIAAAIQEAVKRHVQLRISAGSKFLPDDKHVYAFTVPASQSDYAKSRAKSRQFLIAEVRFGSKHAYLIDPERRLDSDNFPVGIVWRLANRESGVKAYAAMNTEDLKQIIISIEGCLKKGHSWIRLPGLERSMKAEGVNHPRSEPSADDLAAFRKKIEHRLIEAIGDIRIVEQFADKQ